MQLFAALNPHCKRLSIALPARSHAVVDRGRRDENTARHVDEQCRRCRTASSTSAADCTDECRRAWVQTLYQTHPILPPTALHAPASSIPSHLTPSRFPSFHGGHQQTIAAGAAGWCQQSVVTTRQRGGQLSIVRLGFAVSLGANAITAITDVYYGAPPPCTKPHCTPYVCPSVRPLFWPGL